MLGIIIHILPQEIDQLEQTLIQLKYSSKYINEKILIEVVLNFNLTDWDKSILDKNFFINKLKNLENLTQSWAKTNFWVSDNNEILGCTDPRRLCSSKYDDVEAFIWLDVDIIFSDTLLYNMIESFHVLKEKELYFIVTPETTRLWDVTWDVITNKDSFNEEANHQNYFSRDPYITTGLKGEAQLTKIDSFKFAGGWFTLINKNLLNKIPIPLELGPYYLDDTFIMMCCSKGKDKGFNSSQYVINNEVIIENNRFRFNPYKDYLHTIDRREEFKKIANDNFPSSVLNTINKL